MDKAKKSEAAFEELITAMTHQSLFGHIREAIAKWRDKRRERDAAFGSVCRQALRDGELREDYRALGEVFRGDIDAYADSERFCSLPPIVMLMLLLLQDANMEYYDTILFNMTQDEASPPSMSYTKGNDAIEFESPPDRLLRPLMECFEVLALRSDSLQIVENDGVQGYRAAFCLSFKQRDAQIVIAKKKSRPGVSKLSIHIQLQDDQMRNSIIKEAKQKTKPVNARWIDLCDKLYDDLGIVDWLHGERKLTYSFSECLYIALHIRKYLYATNKIRYYALKAISENVHCLLNCCDLPNRSANCESWSKRCFLTNVNLWVAVLLHPAHYGYYSAKWIKRCLGLK